MKTFDQQLRDWERQQEHNPGGPDDDRECCIGDETDCCFRAQPEPDEPEDQIDEAKAWGGMDK